MVYIFPQLVNSLFLSCGRSFYGSLTFKLLITNVNIFLFLRGLLTLFLFLLGLVVTKFALLLFFLTFLISLLLFKILFVCIITTFVSISFSFFFFVSLSVLFFSNAPQSLWNYFKIKLCEIIFLLNLVCHTKLQLKWC